MLPTVLGFATGFEDLSVMLTSPLMLRSLIAAVLVGISAPIVGTFLVHKRLAMLGDGIGHVALTGVALGWLVGSWLNLTSPESLAVPGALAVSVVGAVLLEVIRLTGRTSSDVALAMLFYGGIAGGVLLIGLAGGTSAQLNAYLFGSIATVTNTDIWTIGVLALVIFLVAITLTPALYAVCSDEEFARSTGLPTAALSIAIALLAAFTVAISMRVVGSLLVSAIMIVPVAIAQLFARSFKATLVGGILVGVATCVCGLFITYVLDISPGATIVVLAIGIYALGLIARSTASRLRQNR